MLYQISADRNDGLNCDGTIDAASQADAMKEAKRTFRPFIAKGQILCPIHNRQRCRYHRGERYTFTNIKVTVSTFQPERENERTATK